MRVKKRGFGWLPIVFIIRLIRKGMEYKNLALHEKAWLAGVIDGEGSICKNSKSWRVYRVSVWNNCLPFIQKVMDMTGFGFIACRQPRTPTQAVQYSWYTSKADNIIWLLSSIREFLIIKKAKADEVIKILSVDIISDGRNSKGQFVKGFTYNKKTRCIQCKI